MKTQVNRQTVDLSTFPDLVVIYLGMRVNAWYGLKTLIGFGPRISAAVKDRPAGLLLHEPIIYSLFPAHVGMRQYWKDFDSLERWARSEPHRAWWTTFIRNSGGTGFWHETYFMRGGIEAVYDDLPHRLGLLQFAPAIPARGSMYTARSRARVGGDPTIPVPVEEGSEPPAV